MIRFVNKCHLFDVEFLGNKLGMFLQPTAKLFIHKDYFHTPQRLTYLQFGGHSRTSPQETISRTAAIRAR